ncbi:DNA polymerase-4 [Pseudarcicella hirudinis]|uniref:DNA polymerase IV n=2 Tax=Pseudarcicella hirudinis TaxID=1079859 RepID=A0A1I5M3G0_9BACT|nr:DNA polymerase IV [Pseudarcicella hirudinis]SFP04144.1 DNA polymerase-4 [Pseudarcicella hirudinis]
MERAIAHMDLDCFYVSVERLLNSKLIGKPIIVGGTSDRGVVASCSYETRHFGVRSAMPMRMARQLCPDAIILRGDYEAYTKYSDIVTEIITENTPLVEKSSIDEFYLDMTGMERFFGTWKYAQELRDKVIKETGLSMALGLSTCKTVSKIATNECKPEGKLQVSGQEVKGFLSPLSISKIPLCGAVTTQTLRNMGIANIGTLSRMPLKLLERTFGKNGRMLWERANGIDNTPVVPYSSQKSCSKEITFDRDTTDIVLLRGILMKLTEELCFDLRQSGFNSGCITIKIRYSNFDTHTRQINVLPTTLDHVLIGHVLNLFEKLYDKRLLIRLIGIRLSKLTRGLEQLNIFDQSSKIAPLYQAVDAIKNKYGKNKKGNELIGKALHITQPHNTQALCT